MTINPGVKIHISLTALQHFPARAPNTNTRKPKHSTQCNHPPTNCWSDLQPPTHTHTHNRSRSEVKTHEIINFNITINRRHWFAIIISSKDHTWELSLCIFFIKRGYTVFLRERIFFNLGIRTVWAVCLTESVLTKKKGPYRLEIFMFAVRRWPRDVA